MANTESADPLHRAVEVLEQRVQTLERRLNLNAAFGPESDDLSRVMVDVVRVTQELFPGPVSAQVMGDPEYPQERFTVIEARASGRAEDVLDRQAEWHRRISRLSPHCSTLRLTLDYRP